MVFASIVLACTLTITGCSTVPVQNKPIIEQTNMLQLCGTDTPIPTNFVLNDKGEQVYNGQEVFRVLREWQDYYNKCAAMHNQLVRTIVGVQNITEVPKK